MVLSLDVRSMQKCNVTGLVSSPKQAVQRENRYWKVLDFLHNQGNGIKM